MDKNKASHKAAIPSDKLENENAPVIANVDQTNQKKWWQSADTCESCWLTGTKKKSQKIDFELSETESKLEIIAPENKLVLLLHLLYFMFIIIR